ncbi:MAG: ABC-type transport auxiliary lipoprotein family protein [Gammaproteobacteria bacterium]
MKAARIVALLLSVTLLAACGTVSAPPRDQFHRLVPQELTVRPGGEPAGTSPIVVPPFSASGLHGQRALLYAAADGTTLEQYGYHFWIDSPRLLLQRGLAAHLRHALDARVMNEPGPREGVIVRGHVHRFERVADQNGADAAVVSLGFDVFESGETVPALSRTIERRKELAGDDIAGYVAATSAATREIFDEFARDLAQLVVR